MLEGITKGKIKKPYLVLIYGPDGVGKSTFGSEAPNSIFIGAESGSDALDVARFNGIDSWISFRSKIESLKKENHDFKSGVIDTLDWAEPMLHRYLCEKFKVAAVEDAAGGYGKWVGVMLKEWKSLMVDLTYLRDVKKMNIIILAHSHVKAFNDPNTALPYDRYMLKLNEKAAALWREYVDCVLFANYDIVAFKSETNKKKMKAQDGPRKLFSVRTASYDAKNRLGLPSELPLSYLAFAKAADTGQPDSIENILLRLTN